VTRVGWFRSENDAVVTAYEPPRLAAMRGTSRNAPFHATLEFEDANGGTRVDVAIEIFGAGSARLFMGIFVRWYGNNWERGLIELKRQMESCEL
jgi:hypothetical protein